MEVFAGYEAKWMPVVLDSGEKARAIVYLYQRDLVALLEGDDGLLEVAALAGGLENLFCMDVVGCDYSIFHGAGRSKTTQ